MGGKVVKWVDGWVDWSVVCWAGWAYVGRQDDREKLNFERSLATFYVLDKSIAVHSVRLECHLSVSLRDLHCFSLVEVAKINHQKLSNNIGLT